MSLNENLILVSTLLFQLIKKALEDHLPNLMKYEDSAEIKAFDLSCKYLQHLTNLPKPDKFILIKDVPVLMLMLPRL